MIEYGIQYDEIDSDGHIVALKYEWLTGLDEEEVGLYIDEKMQTYHLMTGAYANPQLVWHEVGPTYLAQGGSDGGYAA